MIDYIPPMLNTYQTVRQLHDSLYVQCQAAKDYVPTKATTKEIADLGLILRKCREYLESSIKMLEEVEKKNSAVGVMWLMQRGDGNGLAGKYCNAFGKVGTSCEVPSLQKDPERYAALCAIMGTQPDPMQRIHFPSVKARITEMLGAGEQLPPGLEHFKMYTETKLECREYDGSTIDRDCLEVTPLF